MNHENKSDDFEYFLINSGFYYKINDTSEEKREKVENMILIMIYIRKN